MPSVVSVMVVHEPGDWFDTTLAALADQDYPNLRTLFLLTPADAPTIAAITDRIRAVLPGAFVRELPGHAGFGPSVNEVLRLVEGDNGFFLLCHDDVAPEPDAVGTMVAELFRSNAGIIGPKLVDWDQPQQLQHVGLGLDRFGELDPVVDPGEIDQEQHDAVRDVFVLPSACLLVRADLFRTLGGFDPSVAFHGEDVDLCWRAHMTGARVIVAPDARVRHRERLVDRRPDINHRSMRARHRMRAVATLTGGSRLFGRSIQMVLVTLVELVVGLFSGRFGEALASVRALVGLVPRSGSIVARRRAIRGQRVVPEREVLGLQDPGSSRLNSYLRGRDMATFVGADTTVRRWRETSLGPVLAWLAIVAGIVIGSRSFISGGVPHVGEFLAFPDSPGELWQHYLSSFDHRGFGATTPVPTGWGLVSIASVVALFRMGLFMTLVVVGLYFAGAIGAWRLATVFSVNRARVAGMVIYVGTPLVPGLLSQGGLSALVWYAALPWMVHLLRRAAGLAAADPAAAADDLTDGVVDLSLSQRARPLAVLSLIGAAATAVVPVVIVLWAIVGLLLAVATLLAMSSWRVAVWLAACTLISVAIGLLLNLPWVLSWKWDELVGAQPAGASGRGLVEMASLAPDGARFSVIAVALYLPLVAALAISRAWRLTWSVRAGLLVMVFGGLIVAAERDLGGVALPGTGLLAVPVALGLALGAAAVAGGFGSDVLGRGFGWRQPVGLIANAAMVIGLIPAVLAVGDGGWHTPRTAMADLLAAQAPVERDLGDYRVLYVGDPRLLPVRANQYRPGIGYAIADAGPLDFTDIFAGPSSPGDQAVEHALDLIASGSTLRAGQVLAPLGIRYIVVPRTDGARSTVDDPLALPDGLIASLQNQLDIGALYGPPSLDIFVNRSWMPVGAQLTGATAEASKLAGSDALVRADLSRAVLSFVGVDGALEGANEVAPGVVHLAVPFDSRITLSVDGREVVARPGFGLTTAFDIDTHGVGTLGYREDSTRRVWVLAQVVLWLALLVVATGLRSPLRRRRGGAGFDETLIDLTGPAPAIAGEVLAPEETADDSILDESVSDALVDRQDVGMSAEEEGR